MFKPMSPVLLRIREERKRRGLTQTELAKRVGVRQATISDLERRSIRRLNMTLLERIARVLKVSATDLIAPAR
jgi:transcriptional regulator with XRE-family HTH domain